ncbi:hypothetical protein KEM52_003922 [Ascosphaera acerosa]|nr:hypothetical protein KEM52_003922 [Ascosphaera acerosa]
MATLVIPSADFPSLDFEDTYDGLGDQLDDADDTLNEDTFGSAAAPAGKDFDFFEKTAQVADVMSEEHELFKRRHGYEEPKATALPQSAAAKLAAGVSSPSKSKPRRTGYEPYKDPDYIPELTAKSSVWGMSSKKAEDAPPSQPSQPAKKMLSLDEVEAQLRSQPASHRPQPLSVEELEAQLHAQAGAATQQQQQQRNPPLPVSEQPLLAADPSRYNRPFQHHTLTPARPPDPYPDFDYPQPHPRPPPTFEEQLAALLSKLDPAIAQRLHRLPRQELVALLQQNADFAHLAQLPGATPAAGALATAAAPAQIGPGPASGPAPGAAPAPAQLRI